MNKFHRHQTILIFVSVAVLLNSCSPFSRVSEGTTFTTSEGYVIASNKNTGFSSKTFGDFKFARNSKEFKELNGMKKPEFKRILYYAKTFDPPYEYYVLLNPKQKVSEEFLLAKDTVMMKNNFVLLISRIAPVSDVEFITNNVISQ